jgi:hypothetical protein
MQPYALIIPYSNMKLLKPLIALPHPSAHLFVDYVNSFVDYDDTSVDYIDFSIDCANKFDDYANTPDD